MSETKQPRQFYKTIITLTVLHDEPLPKDDYNLGELAYAANNTSTVTLHEDWQPPTPLTGAEMVVELQALKVDPDSWDLNEQGNDLSDDEPAMVDLVAGGYEWECPECDHLNKEIEATETVTCGNCEHKFDVGEVHHATG